MLFRSVGGLGPLGDLQVLVLGVGDGQLVQLIARVGLHGDGDAGASGGLVRADGHGAKNKDLKVTKRSETTYTFHMADRKVTVEASFAKDGTVQKPDTRFDDVAKSAWYYKAVEYVAENGRCV